MANSVAPPSRWPSRWSPGRGRPLPAARPPSRTARVDVGQSSPYKCPSSSGSCPVTPKAWPTGRVVTLANWVARRGCRPRVRLRRKPRCPGVPRRLRGGSDGPHHLRACAYRQPLAMGRTSTCSYSAHTVRTAPHHGSAVTTPQLATLTMLVGQPEPGTIQGWRRGRLRSGRSLRPTTAPRRRCRRGGSTPVHVGACRAG